MTGQSTIYDILALMPHRYPLLLIDRIDAMIPGESITAIKNVTINEPFFAGHFPGNPVMPGVLILEAMAQATAFLALKTIEMQNMPRSGNEIFLFTGVDKARFRKMVLPGDQLIIKGKHLRTKVGIFKSEVSVFVDDVLVCGANLTAAYRDVNT